LRPSLSKYSVLLNERGVPPRICHHERSRDPQRGPLLPSLGWRSEGSAFAWPCKKQIPRAKIGTIHEINPSCLPMSVASRLCHLSFVFALDGRDLFHTPLVPATRKRSSQPLIHDLESRIFVDDRGPQRPHIGIIVFARPFGLKLGVNLRCADSGDLVGGDRHANPGATHQDAEIGPVRGHLFRYRTREVGIVARRSRVSTAIVNCDALRGKLLLDFLFQLESGVVRSQCNLHRQHCSAQGGLFTMRKGPFTTESTGKRDRNERHAEKWTAEA